MLSTNPSVFHRLNFTPDFSACVAQGDKEWGLQSILHTFISATLFSSHTFSAPECSSHRRQLSTNFSNMSLSLRLQFFTNCSSVGPFQRVWPSGAAWVPQRVTGPARSLLQSGLPWWGHSLPQAFMAPL